MPDLDFVKVVGRLGLTVADSGDPDDDPDVIWCDSGEVWFTPLISTTKLATSSPSPATLGQSTMRIPVDANGYIGLNGKQYLYLVDLTSEKVNPTIAPGKATHKVEFKNLRAGDTPVQFDSFNTRFAPDTLGIDGACDITLLAPVSSTGSTPIIRGATGDTGETAYEHWLSMGNAGTLADFINGSFTKTHFVTSTPANSLGYVGHMAVDTVTWNVWEKTGEATWVIRGNIKGGAGAQGNPGTPGSGTINLVELTRNRIKNPAIVDLTDWQAESNSSIALRAGEGREGRNAILLTKTGDSGSATGVRNVSGLTFDNLKRYTASFYYKRTSSDFTPGIYISGAAPGHSSNKVLPAPTDQWQRGFFTFTATATGAGLVVPHIGNAPVGTSMLVCDFMLVEGPELWDFFTGSSPGCAWIGTANNSASIKYLDSAAERNALVSTKRTVPQVRNVMLDPKLLKPKPWSVGFQGSNTPDPDLLSFENLTENNKPFYRINFKPDNSTRTWRLFMFKGEGHNLISVGDLVTLRLRYRASGDLVGKRLNFYYQTSAATGSIGAPFGNVTLADNGWNYFVGSVRVSALPTSASGFYTSIGDTTTTFPNGGALDYQELEVLVGEKEYLPTEFVDGDSEWSYWMGTPNDSPSVYAPSQAKDILWKSSVPGFERNLVPDPDMVNPLSTYTWARVDTVNRSRVAGFGGGLYGVRGVSASAGEASVYIPTHKVLAAAGEKFSGSAWVKNDADSARDFRVFIVYRDLAGSTMGYSTTGPMVNVPAGGTARLHIPSGVAPASTNSVALVCASNSAQAGDVFRFSSPALVREERLNGPDFFSARMGGGSWAGDPNNSDSVKAIPYRRDIISPHTAPELSRNLVKNPTATLAPWPSVGSGSAIVTQDYTITKMMFGSPSTKVVLQSNTSRGVFHGDPILNLKASTDYVFSVWVYHESGTAPTITLTDVNYSGGTSLTFTEGTHKWVRKVIRYKTTASQTEMRFYSTSSVTGSTYYVAAAMVTEGVELHDYVDGNQPGCRWLDTPHQSESVRNLQSRAGSDMLSWLDAGRAQGAGSPEGVVVAPVGTEYKDTLATNGAVKWIKRSGTGSTGWQVSYGDTFWRNITSLVTNGWGVDAVFLRRVNNQVFVKTEGLRPSGSTFDAIIPSWFNGFKPIGAAHPGRYIAQESGTKETRRMRIDSTTGLLMTRIGAEPGTYYGEGSFVCDDAWPTTLPGVPA